MNQQQAVTERKPIGAVGALAESYQMDAVAFAQTVKATVFPNGQATNEQLAAFCIVAKEYGLNPFTKQVYAFPSKGGGIVPMISVDGWASIINQHPQFNGMNFRYEKDQQSGEVYAVTCIIHRKDRAHPLVVTEFMEECKGTSQPWAKAPLRMLRHRAMIQCARLAFSFSGLYDETEAKEIVEAEVVNSNVPSPVKSLRGMMQQAEQEQPVVREVEATPVLDNAALDRQIAEEEAKRENPVEFFAGDDKGKAKRTRSTDH